MKNFQSKISSLRFLEILNSWSTCLIDCPKERWSLEHISSMSSILFILTMLPRWFHMLKLRDLNQVNRPMLWTKFWSQIKCGRSSMKCPTFLVSWYSNVLPISWTEKKGKTIHLLKQSAKNTVGGRKRKRFEVFDPE